MGHTNIYYNLLDEFKSPGCAVCKIGRKAVHGWLKSVAYEMVNDPGVRDKLRDAVGFCNQHAYEWLEQRTVLGTAIIYKDVLSHVSQELRGMSYQNRGTMLSGVASLLSGGRSGGKPYQDRGLLKHKGTCPACVAQQVAEQQATETLLGNLAEDSFRQVWENSSALCLPHLSIALEAAPGEGVFDQLIQSALRSHEEMSAQLQEIIRKHDYRFSDEPTGEERGAATRAVRYVVGECGARGLDLRDGER